MKSIFLFELRYRLKRPATYLYAAVFFILGIVFLTTDAVRIGGGYGKVFSNAPYNIHQIISIMGVLGLFIIMAFHAVPVYRDAEFKMDTFLYAYPIRKTDYLLGRFCGTYFMCAAVFLFLPLGMMVGEGINKAMHPDTVDFGPFSAASYLWPYAVALLPTVLLLGTLFFALVSTTRKMMYAYIVAISFIVLYSISQNLISDLDNKFLAAMLDPFGLTAADRVTEYWSISQKNTLRVPLEGVYLWNRLAWMGLAITILVVAVIRFRMSPVAEGSKPKKVEAIEEKKAVRMPGTLWLPDFSPLKSFVTLWVLEVRQTLRNIFFLAFLFAIALYMGMDAWYADRSYETGIHPVTGNMLETVTSSLFSILSMVLIVFLAGEIVWRERQSKMEGIYDAFPIGNGVIFWSKFASLLLVPVFLLALVPLVCIPIQALKGYTHFEPGLYAKTLLLFELPRLWLIAALAFCIQQVVNNKYTGNVAILAYYLSSVGLSYLKVEHPLFRYASQLSYRYSDMNGFGDYVPVFQTYLLHWSLVALLLLAIGYLMMVRGTEATFKSRLRVARQRVAGSRFVQLAVVLPLAGMLGSGYHIYYQTVVLDHFTNSKDDEKAQVAYEKQFGYLQHSAHPSITEAQIGADMWPENGNLILTGNFLYKNKQTKPIDTLWVNFNPEQKIERYQTSVASQVVYSDARKGIRAYRLQKPLMPGDSFRVDMKMTMAFTGLENESPVRGNGTFFNQGYWPSCGFNDGLQLQDEDKRKEYGLKELPVMPAQTDSVAINKGLFDPINDRIRFEATLSTAPDQIAIAPGYLTKKWSQNGRSYFHYKMDRPIEFFYSIISARYQVYSEKWNGINIAIYHHPWHTFNVKKMAEAVRHSLEYYTANFGPYQHKQVRILEFPRYQSFAQSFDNTIPYSESIGFIANLDEKESIDYVYFVTAHEMAHQWWGHQISPAFARGGQFLSETMAEYSALMVMKKRYGQELMGRFLRRELRDYLAGRSREKKKENPLMDIEMQGYAYYNKGSLAMFSVMDLVGEARMNEFLTDFVARYRFTERPYPTTNNYHALLTTYLRPDQLEQANDQLKRITLYKNKVTDAKGRKLPDGQYEVRMKVSLDKVYADSLGNEKAAPFTEMVYVGLLLEETPKKQGDVVLMEKRKLKVNDEVVMKTAIKPKYASVDPLHTLTDIHMDDNARLIDWE